MFDISNQIHETPVDFSIRYFLPVCKPKDPQSTNLDETGK